MGHGYFRKVFSAGLAGFFSLFLGGAAPARGEHVNRYSAAERPGLSPAARFAIRRAHLALTDPVCRQIFLDFQDVSGRPLQERLDSLGRTGQEYLESMLFYDSVDYPFCRDSRTLAMTSPGARVVYLCESKFSSLIRREPSALWVAVLHEMLHSLGLEENPPTSDEISRQVVQRCL